MKTKIKVLSSVITGSFLVGFVDGFLGLNLSEDLYILVGLILLVALIWLLKIVYGKEFNQ